MKLKLGQGLKLLCLLTGLLWGCHKAELVKAVDTESESSAPVDTSSDADTDSDTDTDSDSDSDTDTDTDTDSDVDTTSEPDSESEMVSTRIPEKHRESATFCEGVHVSPQPPEGVSGSCSRHEDCIDGKNGRCTIGIWSYYGCVYDECAVDADCGTGGLCHCSATESARCVTMGNCTLDADCGAGGYCSPSSMWSCEAYISIDVYACHTAADECTNHSDCGENAYCSFNTYDNLWQCISMFAGCPVG